MCIRSPPPEQEPMSSVFDTSLEEDMTMFLVMMSRDVNWRMRNQRFLTDDEEIEKGEALMESEEEIEEIQE
ncbi:hypothetical protein LINPERHAP1_LOCUS6291 [Linum perenne]